jgi:hypothetical protein
VHFLQRKTLERKWEEDFPALRTEGGRPGSPDAGIVAFIRERLVDLSEHTPPTDIEAQNDREMLRRVSYESEREDTDSEDMHRKESATVTKSSSPFAADTTQAPTPASTAPSVTVVLDGVRTNPAGKSRG